MICPYCEQGELYIAHIKNIERKVVLCQECDSIWAIDEDVSNRTGTNLQDFMLSQGKECDWSLIVDLQKYEL